MKKYKAIFFDLDHTLWDFDLNSEETIAEIFHNQKLEQLGITDPQLFIKEYKEVNKQMWDLYNENRISKEFLRSGRFRMALNAFNVSNDDLADTMASEYLKICPQKTNLFPGAIDTLDYLSQKYSLHVITNGFLEVQYTKIKNSGIGKYFDHIHISEEIGFKKPEPEIFHFAVKQAGTIHENCIMIGDNTETDIAGAQNAGIDHILFNPHRLEVPNFVNQSVNSLTELKILL
ncbi:MAG: noncanonical pyrimidine nucleotidase, YjjG family [Bacteroidetes bacterium]|nr:noncanonical pyrimidine nucleotidase, YjjG family [Bacteroidota bacterium]